MAALVLLLLIRGFIYREMGAEVDWTPSIPLGPIVLTFRSDFPARIFIFSFLSFAVCLGIFYTSLLLLSVVNQSLPEGNPHQRWVRARLGLLERWPRWAKLLLPWFGLTLGWLALSPLLVRFNFVPQTKSAKLLVEQAALIGLGSYLCWKILIAVILAAHIVNTYVYLGNAPFWNFLNPTAKAFLKPLSFLPLHLGKFDFAPVIMMILVFALSEGIARALTRLYSGLAV